MSDKDLITWLMALDDTSVLWSGVLRWANDLVKINDDTKEFILLGNSDTCPLCARAGRRFVGRDGRIHYNNEKCELCPVTLIAPYPTDPNKEVPCTSLLAVIRSKTTDEKMTATAQLYIDRMKRKIKRKECCSGCGIRLDRERKLGTDGYLCSECYVEKLNAGITLP